MMEILAPISGRIVSLSEVSDEVFASGMAGEGAAIVPSESGEVLAPVSGRLVKLFEGGHAFGIETDGGVEMIVHVGIDTIELRGADFEKIATEARLRAMAEERGIAFSDVVHPLRVALTGMRVSPGIFEVLQLMGRELVLQRIEDAIWHLEGGSLSAVS